MKTALYIGRFQLFHRGHLDVIQHIGQAEDIEEIVLAIGSSQYNHQNKSPVAPWAVNPFTYEERKEMLEKSLDVQKPFSIHSLPDYHNYPKWFQHIAEQLPKSDIIYTVSKQEKDFFEEQGMEVRDFPVRFDYHAGVLRERIYKAEEYREALPPGTIEVVDRIHAEDRIKDLFAKDIAESIAL